MDINFYLEGKNIFHIFHNIPPINLESENDNNSEIENCSIIHSNNILDNLSYNEKELEDSDFNLSFLIDFLETLKLKINQLIKIQIIKCQKICLSFKKKK